MGTVKNHQEMGAYLGHLAAINLGYLGPIRFGGFHGDGNLRGWNLAIECVQKDSHK